MFGLFTQVLDSISGCTDGESNTGFWVWLLCVFTSSWYNSYLKRQTGTLGSVNLGPNAEVCEGLGGAQSTDGACAAPQHCCPGGALAARVFFHQTHHHAAVGQVRFEMWSAVRWEWWCGCGRPCSVLRAPICFNASALLKKAWTSSNSSTVHCDTVLWVLSVLQRQAEPVYLHLRNRQCEVVTCWLLCGKEQWRILAVSFAVAKAVNTSVFSKVLLIPQLHFISK